MTSLKDFPQIIVVNIDNQNDFVSPNGSLSVPGAVEAVERTISFIDNNCEIITTIISSLDQHLQTHIFYNVWWINANGDHPNDFTEITYDDVVSGFWKPIFDHDWSLKYVKALGKITIWPVHCTVGTSGSDMDYALTRAITRHMFRHCLPHYNPIEKGQNNRTEHYGIFGAEVEDPFDPRTKLNVDLIQKIAGYDLSFWLGQEKGHCVQRSLEQYIGWCEINQPEAIKKMRYVEDCIGSLKLGPEYDKALEDSVKSMVAKGMVVVKSTCPIL